MPKQLDEAVEKAIIDKAQEDVKNGVHDNQNSVGLADIVFYPLNKLDGSEDDRSAKSELYEKAHGEFTKVYGKK